MTKNQIRSSTTGAFAISRKGVANINRVEGLVMRSATCGRYIKIADSNKTATARIEILKSEFGSKKKK